MRFEKPLIKAKLINRYKRFLADVRLESDSVITVHCPNSGSMKTCLGKEWPVYISDSGNPKRKYLHTLEMIHNGNCWIGVNTHLANKIVKEAIENGTIKHLSNYTTIRTEVKYSDNSRIDILLENEDNKCYVEIKNVSMVQDGVYRFPDSVTTRGTKHLHDLMKMIDEGHRAVMIYCIQRSDGDYFEPAYDIDPTYSEALHKAKNHGVEAYAYIANVTSEGIYLQRETEIKLK